MPSLLRSKGRSKDHNVSNDLQQGRKRRRFDKELCAGIALMLAITLPAFRRFTLDKEVNSIQLLGTNHAGII